MYKADLCRGAALYETGGLYFDVDIGVRINLWQVLRHSTKFATVRTYGSNDGFFQAFLAADSHHPVILRYVQLFSRHFRGEKLGFTPASDQPPVKMVRTVLTEIIGVILLQRAFDEIQAEQNRHPPKPSVHTFTRSPKKNP